MNNYYFDFGYLDSLDDDIVEIDDIYQRFQHVYILGRTRIGKSNLMEQMAHYDISEGYSVIYLDPKGSTIHRLYSLHSDNPKIKYVSFDRPIGINPLRKAGYDDDVLINEFIQILDILITITSPNPESTVRMKHILNKVFLGLPDKNKTIQYLYKFLSQELDFKKQEFTDIEIKDWWDKLFKSKDDKSSFHWKDFSGTMDSIASRLSMFIDSPKMSRFLTDDNELYIDEIVNNGESLLINTNTHLFDNRIFLTNLIIYACYSYVFQKDVKRKPLLIYVDEFQLVASPLFPLMLQIAGESQIGFVLANQDIGQLNLNLFKSVFSNCGTKIGFSCGYDEAEILSHYFKVSPEEVMDLPKYNAYVRVENNIAKVEIFEPLNVKLKPLPELSSGNNFLGDEWIDLL